MNKCEHGQKITIFCASDCCVWKQAAGCEACIKKYHNHMGTTNFLNEQDIVSIVKKYTMDSSIKPKCRPLQQAIYNYFNVIKTQLTNSLDTVCKNIINQIGYPYLYANNTLSTYKRLKNKQYKKLIQKQFKLLYEMTQKISDRDLIKEQSQIYITQMKKNQVLLTNIENVILNYSEIIKTNLQGFTHDATHYKKIKDTFKSMNQASKSPKKIKKDDHSIKKSVEIHQSSSLKQEKSKPQQQKSAIRPSAITTLNVKPNYSKNVSIDRKIVKQTRTFQTLSGKKQKQQKSDVKIQESKKVELKRQTSQKVQLYNTRQFEINEKKKILIDMMKNKEESSKGTRQKTQQAEKKSQFDSIKVNWLEIPAFKTVNTNSSKSFKDNQNGNAISSNSFSEEQQDMKNIAFTKLPDETSYAPAKLSHEKITETVILITTPELKQSQLHNEEVQSPLLKKKNTLAKYLESKMYESIKQKNIPPKPNNQNGESRTIQTIQKPFTSIKLQTVVPMKRVQNRLSVQQQVKQAEKRIQLFPITHQQAEPSSKNDEYLSMKQSEQRSLALLLKSLTLKAEEAIVYLQKAIKQADTNLSAAEYLSFIYLQLQRPSDCLKLCNKIIQKLQKNQQPQQLTLIMNNNKAAALNILGRYSESIFLLQKCVTIREKDYFFKNLGDAYFSMSIYDKAIYNWQKALKLNENYDQALYNMAVCLYIQQNYYNALHAIKKALQINKTSQQYYQLLENIQTRMNHYET